MVASTSPRFTTWRTFRRRCRWSTMAPSSPHPLGMASCVTAPLRVSWVSPKTWGSYIYGNVRFTFDWGSLYRENHYAYWIGFDDAGRQKILRVFLSSTPHDGLTRIDPRRDRGAWQVTPAGEHVWNSAYTLEFMVDGLVFLDPHLIDVQFVNHRRPDCIENV